MSATPLLQFPMDIDTVNDVVRRALRACGLTGILRQITLHHDIWYELTLTGRRASDAIAIVITVAPRMPVTLEVVSRDETHPDEPGKVLYETTAIHADELFHTTCWLAMLCLNAANDQPC